MFLLIILVKILILMLLSTICGVFIALDRCYHRKMLYRSLLKKIKAVSRVPNGSYPRATLAARAMKEAATAPP
jgi:hypothetical protein